MQKVIDILDEMMEEHKKVLKNEWMCDYDIDNTIRSNILNEAKSRIQALWDWWISVTPESMHEEWSTILVTWDIEKWILKYSEKIAIIRHKILGWYKRIFKK